MILLKAKNLTKSFTSPKRVDVLKEISLEVKRGESIAICGRSGEGKTTLLHILGTLEPPDQGSIEIAGQPFSPTNVCELRLAHVGFIFQSFNLLEDFTVLENVLMPAKIARKKIDPAHGSPLLEWVGLEERAQFPVNLLSGGERQRVAIARALCNNPDLILADEPSGNLDRSHRKKIGDLLLSCVKKKNKGLILVTHDTELASLCDHRYTLRDGHLTKE